VVLIKNKRNLKIYFKNYDSGSISQELVEFIVHQNWRKASGLKHGGYIRLTQEGSEVLTVFSEMPL